MRSRATGLYGETLHSGQVTDRASPGTGDYARSDISEEPQHGRSTRAGNRGAINGRNRNQTLDSDGDDDATSWDGGDEDEDEPDQMVLDEDDDARTDSEEEEEEEEEPQTLMVTLRYGKGAAHPPSGPTSSDPSQDVNMENGAEQQDTRQFGAPLAGIGAPRQPEPAPAPTALQQPAQPVQAPLASVSNGLPVVAHQPYAAPIIPVAYPQPQSSNPVEQPQANGLFSAPTPPYTAPEEAPKAQQPTSVFVPNPEVHQQQQQPPSLPSPTPASSWQ